MLHDTLKCKRAISCVMKYSYFDCTPAVYGSYNIKRQRLQFYVTSFITATINSCSLLKEVLQCWLVISIVDGRISWRPGRNGVYFRFKGSQFRWEVNLKSGQLFVVDGKGWGGGEGGSMKTQAHRIACKCALKWNSARTALPQPKKHLFLVWRSSGSVQSPLLLPRTVTSRQNWELDSNWYEANLCYKNNSFWFR